MLPIAVAPRVVHVRIPEPIDVRAAEAGATDEGPARAELLRRLHAGMQATLDELNREIAPAIERWLRPNPLHLRS